MSKLIGDRAFYKRLLLVMLPILIQNFITNFVSMLDNIMVGRVGTAEMTGVAVSNQLLFVFNLCIFGAISGAGIFGAQFFGKGDHKGVRDTFRFKIVFSILLTLVGVLVFVFGGEALIRAYLMGEGDPQNAAASLDFAKRYLWVMLLGLPPYAIVQSYSGTLRETGKTMPPMVAGIIAVLVNLALNAILIFGAFGLPALGVVGAAVATVISRYVELFIVVLWTKRNRATTPFIQGAFRSLYVPGSLVRDILRKGLPLMLNETMWAGGIAVVNQSYSVRGLDVVGAMNICQTFHNVFSVSFLAVGVAIGIVLGQMLGAGKCEEAKESSGKLIAFSVTMSIVVALLFSVAAEFIPFIYKTTPEIRLLATRLMQICALVMPLDAFANSAYFTLRSGGKTLITFLFDSGFVWAVSVPVSFLLSRFTNMPVLPLYAVCSGLNLIKCVVGFAFVKKGVWVVNIVGEKEKTA